MVEFVGPLAALSRRHRLDRLVVLFHLAQQPYDGIDRCRADRARCRKRAVVSAWRQVLWSAKISCCAKSVAGDLALVLCRCLHDYFIGLLLVVSKLLWPSGNLFNRSARRHAIEATGHCVGNGFHRRQLVGLRRRMLLTAASQCQSSSECTGGI